MPLLLFLQVITHHGSPMQLYVAPSHTMDFFAMYVTTPYNPGSLSILIQCTSCAHRDFYIWTFAYDVSGIDSVVFNYRKDMDGVNPTGDISNDVYQSGQLFLQAPSDIHAWYDCSLFSYTCRPVTCLRVDNSEYEPKSISQGDSLTGRHTEKRVHVMSACTS